jgi:hypothetical protein
VPSFSQSLLQVASIDVLGAATLFFNEFTHAPDPPPCWGQPETKKPTQRTKVAIRVVGLLCNEPPGMAGLPFM